MLLLSTFGTCYSRSFCLVCNNIEGKRKSQTIFKLVCRKWSLWTHKSNGCKLRIDSCHGPNQNSEQNLWGRMLARERFPTFAWQKKTSECCEHCNVSVADFFLQVLEESYDAMWQRVTPLPSVGPNAQNTYPSVPRDSATILYIFIYIYVGKNLPRASVDMRIWIRSLVPVMQTSIWLQVYQKQEEQSL